MIYSGQKHLQEASPDLLMQIKDAYTQRNIELPIANDILSEVQRNYAIYLQTLNNSVNSVASVSQS